MTLSFLYWFFVLLWVLFYGWWGLRPNGDRYVFGPGLIGLLLLLVLGLKVFGWPIQG